MVQFDGEHLTVFLGVGTIIGGGRRILSGVLGRPEVQVQRPIPKTEKGPLEPILKDGRVVDVREGFRKPPTTVQQTSELFQKPPLIPYSQMDSIFAKAAEEVWLDKRLPNVPIVVARSSDILDLWSSQTGRPLIIESDVITKARDKHSLSLENIQQLPIKLRDPIAIFQSKQHPRSVLVITDIVDKNGQSIVPAIHLDKRSGRYVVHEIATVGSRQRGEIQSWLDDNLLLYQRDDKTIKGWFQSVGLIAPLEGTTPLAKEELPPLRRTRERILTKEDLVKYQLDKSTQSRSTFVEEELKLRKLLSLHGIDNIVIALAEKIPTPKGTLAAGSYVPGKGLVKITKIPRKTTGYHEAFHVLARKAGLEEQFQIALKETMDDHGVDINQAEESPTAWGVKRPDLPRIPSS